MDFNERIAKLAELEVYVMPLNWETSGAAKENIVDSRGLFIAETNSDDDAALIVALRNESLPLLREMAQALSEARAENERMKADADRTDKAFSKTLKDLVLANRESKRFGNQMVLAVNKVCELEQERDALQARVDGSLTLLNNFMLGGKSDDVYDAIEILTGEGE